MLVAFLHGGNSIRLFRFARRFGHGLFALRGRDEFGSRVGQIVRRIGGLRSRLSGSGSRTLGPAHTLQGALHRFVERHDGRSYFRQEDFGIEFFFGHFEFNGER